ncbi:Sec2p-domain-containing protein [Trichodelitschia bisporula]|uniref:Sec2p-domain-containing protein n=1 Tax=Trichodelitschia bisporula TaxID=703511 RepID=A0A6G1HNF1_9PEZI|nr:Sec2p-domain-containing protein [Trichodelitschia bisporula]
MAAAVAPAPAIPSRLFPADSEAMNTIRDPRTPSPSSSLSRSDSTASAPHPDLSSEVATLSSKLVNAINHQTNLDDALQGARHDLEMARRRMDKLEAAVKQHEQLVSSGSLLRKEDIEAREARMVAELEEERKLRAKAEAEKKKMEQELGDLTTALFEEANTMVVTARMKAEALEKRNEQLKLQIGDTEVLLRSQQDQLHDLKVVVERMSSEYDENESTAQISTAPSTPGILPHDNLVKAFEASNATPLTPIGTEDVQPDQPLRFPHLLQPVLRTDLTAFNEFRAIAKSIPKVGASQPPSRVTSGSFGSLNVMGLGAGLNLHKTSASTPATPTHASFSFPPREVTPSMPLKDTPVYKRALAEDIEPTLRLDMAPGLSWLQRRSVVQSISSGTLCVEPLPASSVPSGAATKAPPCALCGESRTEAKYERRHRLRTSEEKEGTQQSNTSSRDAAKFALCEHCVAGLRAACDYVGFLRMVRDGLWRVESDEDVRAAWEESVRLRERMFWIRVGGGVVPTTAARAEVRSDEGIEGRISQEKSLGSPVKKRVSISNTVETLMSKPHPPTNVQAEIKETGKVENADEDSVRNSVASSAGDTVVGAQAAALTTGLEPAALTEAVATHDAATTPAPLPEAYARANRPGLSIPGAFE